MSNKDWDFQFGPSYTPKEMLDMGIMMDSYYFAASKLPKKYKNHPKALKRGDKKDPTKNYFGVSSREKLWQWKQRNKIFTDKCGWLEWYFFYFEGRRLGDEDEKQIKRWKSFVARHQGAITKSGKLKDLKARVKQRQGLLQWGWDSTVPYSQEEAQKNAKRVARSAGAKVTAVSKESLPPSLDW